jgi:hypothetical protein
VVAITGIGGGQGQAALFSMSQSMAECPQGIKEQLRAIPSRWRARVPMAAGHFGWFAHFAVLDNPTSSRRTREVLGWQPKAPGLLADRDQPYYF